MRGSRGERVVVKASARDPARSSGDSWSLLRSAVVWPHDTTMQRGRILDPETPYSRRATITIAPMDRESAFAGCCHDRSVQ